MESLLEVYDQVDRQFADHLEDKNNDKIIFSGKFGTGKDYIFEEV